MVGGVCHRLLNDVGEPLAHLGEHEVSEVTDFKDFWLEVLFFTVCRVIRGVSSLFVGEGPHVVRNVHSLDDAPLFGLEILGVDQPIKTPLCFGVHTGLFQQRHVRVARAGDRLKSLVLVSLNEGEQVIVFDFPLELGQVPLLLFKVETNASPALLKIDKVHEFGLGVLLQEVGHAVRTQVGIGLANQKASHELEDVQVQVSEGL
mmetsp:Transcript_16068/g.24943  ORF Transcript_16068/g.24943 Transcript_16068/m.24943 type:complete len:204 (-) Transcript_16068:1821-2432(-)